jgi:alkylhydroperoxidase family enzyme
VSGQTTGDDVDLDTVNGGVEGDGGVEHGARLVAFTEAVMSGDKAGLAGERAALRALLTPEAFVDAAAVIGAFNVVDRIANATGIPLDAGLAAMSGEVREELDLVRFGSSANTP